MFPIVLAGPSGGGKTTVGRALEARRSDVRFSVSATTRPPRPGERDGIDYRFMANEEFDRLVRNDKLLEWAEVHGERYGTPRANLDAACAAGAHLLLDIDVQGARSVRRLVPRVVTVFLVPPSGERIIQRLRGRGSETAADLRRRLKAAEAELDAAGEFDYLLVNDRLEDAVDRLDSIVEAEECRMERAGERPPRGVAELMEDIRTALEGPLTNRDSAVPEEVERR